MTDFILGPGETHVQCPYSTAHQITNAKLLTHLEKCRKSYLKTMHLEGREPQMKICRFNSLHQHLAPEIKFHEERCPDADSVIRHMAYHNSEEANRYYEGRQQEQQQQNNQSCEDVKPDVDNNGEEDWDAECTGYEAGYDPTIKLKKEVILYNPSGMTKSERKKFRHEYRVTATEITEKGESRELPTAATFEVKPDVKNIPIKKEHESRDKPIERDDNDGRSSGKSYESSRRDSERDDKYSRSSGNSYESSRKDSERDDKYSRSSGKSYESSRRDYDRNDNYGRSNGKSCDSSGRDYDRSYNSRGSTGGHTSAYYDTTSSYQQSSYSKQSSYKAGYESSHSSSQSSKSRARSNEPEFSEDDFEGDDPYAQE